LIGNHVKISSGLRPAFCYPITAQESHHGNQIQADHLHDGHTILRDVKGKAFEIDHGARVI